ncbi:hypothetical protein [Dokdonella sp.]|uniref:bestrophin-like domain n=1 Tax=Dokdonella sp. TaxID=2291710 RepID=UPI0035299B62
MIDLIFGQNSVLIAGSALAAMVGAIEIGFRIGRRSDERVSKSAHAHIGAIQASLLGMLALLLGFTLSLSLQRYDTRSEAVVDEANAIGTAWLRAQLLPGSVRGQVLEGMRRHVDLRVDAGEIDLAHPAERSRLLGQTNENLNRLWGLALTAAEENPSPVTTGLYIQALNEMIDSHGQRGAALNRHVPQTVLLLLFGTFLLTGSVVGYASGVAGHRPSATTHVLAVLIVVLAFVILDLDRPRRGLIRVDQSSLLDLQSAIHAAGKRADPASLALPAQSPPRH